MRKIQGWLVGSMREEVWLKVLASSSVSLHLGNTEGKHVSARLSACPRELKETQVSGSHRLTWAVPAPGGGPGATPPPPLPTATIQSFLRGDNRGQRVQRSRDLIVMQTSAGCRKRMREQARNTRGAVSIFHHLFFTQIKFASQTSISLGELKVRGDYLQVKVTYFVNLVIRVICICSV